MCWNVCRGFPIWAALWETSKRDFRAALLQRQRPKIIFLDSPRRSVFRSRNPLILKPEYSYTWSGNALRPTTQDVSCLTLHPAPRIVIGLGICCNSIRRRTDTMSKPSDLIQGTLDLLILRTIALDPMHGWAIAKRIEQVSEEVLQVTQGALYPALHRLEQQGWVRAAWRKTETGREAKFYEMTKAGRAQLDKELAQWERLSSAVGLVIRAAQE